MLVRCRAIDLETTGMPDQGGRICEIGWSDVLIMSGGKLSFPVNESRLVNPFHPIPPEAMAVHHITDSDVASAPPASEVLPPILEGADLFVAHSVDFERAFIRTDRPWVCTMKVGLRIFRDARSLKLQYFRYRLGLDLDPKLSHPPHRAGPDAYVTARIFAEFLKHMSVEKMIEVSLLPTLLHICDTGKYRGSGITWAEVARVDREWCQFVMRNDRGMFHPDVAYTAAHYLSGRS